MESRSVLDFIFLPCVGTYVAMRAVVVRYRLCFSSDRGWQQTDLQRAVQRLLPGYGVDEPETGIEGGDWCQTRPMGLTKGGLPPFSRLPGTLVRLPVEIRSKTALILCPLPGVAYKEGTVGTSQRVPAPTRAAGGGHHDHE